jgi:arylsulfatase A-like enzyme
MVASVSLSYVAAMQEHGIPVTFAYISDAHDNHGTSGSIHVAYGPGEAGYVQQLKDYDRAFGTFFARLAADGITKDNTLFVITVEEGDHFVGSEPSPPGCDGVSTPCTYSQIGEINTNLAGLLATQKNNITPFTVHSDVAPTVYVTGNPGRTDAAVRQLERDTGSLTATNPYTGTTDEVTAALADPVEESTLHMVTSDPARTPTFTLFGDPHYFFFTGAKNCASPCVFVPPPSNQTFAWNHGSIQDEIATTWAGYVGPGVRRLGDVRAVWSDHTDLRPTMLTLLGLKDDYVHDGRAVVEPLFDWAVPQSLRAHRATLIGLGAVYKQLTAPFGQFGMDTLRASTAALKSGSAGDDSKYESIENRLQSLTADRNDTAKQVRDLLDAAEFGGRTLNERDALKLILRAGALILRAKLLAASS